MVLLASGKLYETISTEKSEAVFIYLALALPKLTCHS